jgi:hypothetical protein
MPISLGPESLGVVNEVKEEVEPTKEFCPYCETDITNHPDPRDHERDCLEAMEQILSCPHCQIRLKGAPRDFQIEHIFDCRTLIGSQVITMKLPPVPKKAESHANLEFAAKIVRHKNRNTGRFYNQPAY